MIYLGKLLLKIFFNEYIILKQFVYVQVQQSNLDVILVFQQYGNKIFTYDDVIGKTANLVNGA